MQWALPYAHFTKGTSYDASVVKYNCANAQSYVRTLVKERMDILRGCHRWANAMCASSRIRTLPSCGSSTPNTKATFAI